MFGGDCAQVTVMGESAGGGSILHQITAFGGVKAPFNRLFCKALLSFPDR
jgi:carboxylesterase type B